jgi:hypothetical protein
MPTESRDVPEDDFAAREAELERLTEEIERESARVGIDWDAARGRMRDLAERHEGMPTEDDSIEVALGLDATRLVHTLRSLPTGAGTAAFLAAFANDQSDSAAPPA